MSATIERSRAVETEFIRDVQFGPYRVLGVPHISLSRPTPTGENYIRNANVDFKLAEICEYMADHGIQCVHYTEF
jgi:hypothetical protein